MQTLLDELYDQYNRFVPDIDIQKKIEECHQQLIRCLDKPERKLILRIIDSKDLISGFRAKESFACGFWLAWRMLSQLRSYDNDRSLEKFLKESGRFAMQEGDVVPHTRPVCDLTQEVRAVPLPEPQTDCAADVPAIAEGISSVSDIAAGTQCAQGVPEPESAADTVTQEVSPTAQARQKQHPKESISAPKESTPQMGDTRVVDGKKQVYFLGFGWIDANGDGGGGIIVDGDGDINKMVGDM